MDSKDLARKTAHLNALLEQKLALRKGTLGQRADRAGRRLPRWVRRNLHQLDCAQSMAGHPKMARMLDGEDLDRAYLSAADHLKAIDPREGRKDRLLGVLGSLAFNILMLAVLLYAVLRWQGIV